LQRGSPGSGSAFNQRLRAAGVVFLDARLPLLISIEVIASDRMPDGGRGLLVVKHRAEIAHIKPVFKEVKLDRGRPMASANENS
jgi:hypothetical protein